MKKINRGFSLVELLVGVAISLVGMVAVVEIYTNSRQVQRVQALQSRLAEDGRYAQSMIRRIVSQAGFRPNPTTALPSDRFSIAANVATVKFTADGQNQVGCNGAVLAANVSQTIVLQKSGSKLQCDAIDWIVPSTSGTALGTELVDLLFLYGIDTGPANTPTNFGCGADVAGVKPRDCIVDSFVTSLGGATSAQIVAVRVCFVLRTQVADSAIVKSGAAKDCSGNDVAGSASDNKLYRTYVSTIQLRNR